MKEKLKRIVRILGYILIMVVFAGGLATDQYQHCYIAMGLLEIDILMNISEILEDLIKIKTLTHNKTFELNENLIRLMSMLDKKESEPIEPLRVGSFGAKGQKKLARKINEVIERKD